MEATETDDAADQARPRQPARRKRAVASVLVRPAEPGPRRRAPRGGADVPTVLLAAAIDLFASQNYSSVTIKDIARHTGINTGLIYYYFKNKEDLFLRAVEETAEVAFGKFQAVSDGAADPRMIISIWIEIHSLHFILLRKLAKVSLDYASTATRSPRIDRAIRRFYDKESVVLGEAMRIGIEQGVFRQIDAPRMSVFISTFLDGCLFRSVMFPKFSYRQAMEDLRDVLLDYICLPATKIT